MALKISHLFAVLAALFVGFAGVYCWIYVSGGKWRAGEEQRPLPTFFLSDAFNARLRTVAANELGILSIDRPELPIFWAQLYPAANNPVVGGRLNNGMSPTATELIESLFFKYRDGTATFWTDPPWSGKKSFANEVALLHDDLKSRGLLFEPEYTRMRDELIRHFKNRDTYTLGEVGAYIRLSVEGYFKRCPDRDVCKEVVYPRVAGAIANGTRVSLERLAERLNFWDFLYFSVVAGTTTGYGDIVPASRLARMVNAAQILITYCLLALITARLVDYFAVSRQG